MCLKWPYSHLAAATATPQPDTCLTLESYLQGRYTAKTAASYARETGIYLASFPQAETATHGDIAAYMGQLRTRYSNPKTLNRILAGVKAYYDYLAAMGKREDNPAKSIRLRDKRSDDIQLQDLFTDKELALLLEDRQERNPLLAIRNRVLVGLLIWQGLRPEELQELETDSIDLEAGRIYIRATAMTNGRSLPLQPQQVLLLPRYMEDIRPALLGGKTGEKLLISQRGNGMSGEDITKYIKRRYRGLYHPRVLNCMTIRQSVIANMLRSGRDLRLVQVFAGHKYPSSTERYRQRDAQALKEAIEQYHPVR